MSYQQRTHLPPFQTQARLTSRLDTAEDNLTATQKENSDLKSALDNAASTIASLSADVDELKKPKAKASVMLTTDPTDADAAQVAIRAVGDADGGNGGGFTLAVMHPVLSGGDGDGNDDAGPVTTDEVNIGSTGNVGLG